MWQVFARILPAGLYQAQSAAGNCKARGLPHWQQGELHRPGFATTCRSYRTHQPPDSHTRLRWPDLACRVRSASSPRRHLTSATVKYGIRRTLTVDRCGRDGGVPQVVAHSHELGILIYKKQRGFVGPVNAIATLPFFLRNLYQNMGWSGVFSLKLEATEVAPHQEGYVYTLHAGVLLIA